MDGGQPEGYVRTAEQLQCSAATILLVKGIGDALERHYPGWAWAVQPDERGGVLNIFSLRLSGEWGYRFLLRDVQDDPTHAREIMAGGEIQVRFGVPRSGYSYEVWKLTRKDIAGLARADVTDKAAKVQRTQRDEALTNAVRNGSVRIKYEDTVGRDQTHRRIIVTGGHNGS